MKLLVAIAVLLCAQIAISAPADQLITELPGLPVDISELGFNMYSGYVNINAEHNTNFFYWFVESSRDPTTDPVLLWMNGGPGASSLMGFFTEHGPFRPSPDGTDLMMFDYPWNQIANIIYLESPIGVGFSYSDEPLEYITNDNKTARQNYDFLLAWFELFPEFKANDFWITGESYAGKYCPELANLVLNGIQAGDTPWLNMKGIIVGNPGTESDWYGAPNEYAFMTFLYEHMLIPQANYQKTFNACGWSDFLTNCDGDYTNPSQECKQAVLEAVHYMPKDIDVYNIYAPTCVADEEKAKKLSKYISKWHPIFRYANANDDSQYIYDNFTFYPCIDDYMTSYLNQADVQAAIHVNPTNWDYISSTMKYVHEYKYSVVPLWQRFINETDWRLLVFSGDVDAAVPTIGTQRWLNCLGQPVTGAWRPWYYANQTAGIRQDFQGISFITIKGAGHMVPYYMPPQGFAFFEWWMSDADVDYSKK